MNGMTDIEKEQISISSPRSGFVVTVPRQILDHFGGMDVQVICKHQENKDGSVWIAITKGHKAKARRGELALRVQTGGSTHPARVLWRGQYAPAPPSRHEFKQVFVPWHWDNHEKTTFSFVLPPPEKLQKAQSKSKPDRRQGSLPLMHRKPAPVPDTGGQVAALAAAFSTIGNILGNPGPEVRRLFSSKRDDDEAR